MGLDELGSEHILLSDLGEVESLDNRQFPRRVFRGIGVVSLVLASTPPVIGMFASCYYQIYYGGYWGLMWGWVLGCAAFIPAVLATSELCSSMPLNGANYIWTAALAPSSLSRPLSFMMGWFNILLFMAGLAGFSYAFSTSLVATISVLSPTAWSPTPAQGMGVSMGMIVLWAAMSQVRMEKLKIIYITSAVIVVTTIIIYVVGLPVSHATQKLPFTPPSMVFGEYDNYSNWPRSIASQFTLFTAIWSVAGWNGPGYIVEQMHDGARSGPRSMINSFLVLAITGFGICLVTAFCITDIKAAALDKTGFPLYTVLNSHWGKNITFAYLTVAMINAALGGSGFLFTISCQVAAFARAGGLPFSEKLTYVNAKTNMPVYSMMTVASGGLLILLFSLSTIARTTIFSLSIIAGLLVLLLPIVMRVTAGSRFIPGPWSLGKFSVPMHCLAILTITYLVIIESFPPNPDWDTASFNYNWVVTVGVVLLCATFWFTKGSSSFTGVPPGVLEKWTANNATAHVDTSEFQGLGEEAEEGEAKTIKC